jgi:hypothetical protein
MTATLPVVPGSPAHGRAGRESPWRHVLTAPVGEPDRASVSELGVSELGVREVGVGEVDRRTIVIGAADQARR